jgi:hypothetical protein
VIASNAYVAFSSTSNSAVDLTVFCLREAVEAGGNNGKLKDEGYGIEEALTFQLS